MDAAREPGDRARARRSNTFFCRRESEPGVAYLVAEALVAAGDGRARLARRLPLFPIRRKAARPSPSAPTLRYTPSLRRTIRRQLRLPPRRARLDDRRHGPRPHGPGPRPRRLRGRAARRLQGGRPGALPRRRGAASTTSNAPEFLRGKRVVIAEDARPTTRTSPSSRRSRTGDPSGRSVLLCADDRLPTPIPTAGAARTRSSSGRRTSGSSTSARSATARSREIREPRRVDPVLQREPHRRDGRQPPRVDDLAPAPLGLADHVPAVRRTARRRASSVHFPRRRGQRRRRRKREKEKISSKGSERPSASTARTPGTTTRFPRLTF